MDTKANLEINMPSEPPAYRFIPRVPKERKEMILIAVVLVLLSTVVIGAILIGVYMTQQHTEKVIKMVSNKSDGEVVEQTLMVNNQESVAVFQIQSNTTLATVVYDYEKRLIGFRIKDKKQCSVVAMDAVDIPSLHEITQGIEHFDELASSGGDSGDYVTYSFKQGERADRATLGTTVNILCSDVPVYWAENDKGQKTERKGICVGILLLKACIMLPIALVL
uniref:Surfactant protein C n=1 Tax=Salvator merianae TaxID=96440 RepID=A0A8D0BS55_SALMN